MTSPDVIKELLFVLIDAAEEVNDMVDIVDGADGQPAPNWAMKLWSSLDEAIRMGQAHLKTIEPEVSSTTWTGIPYTDEGLSKEDRAADWADRENDAAALEDP